MDQLKAELIIDEGKVNKIYTCSAKKPTFGVGHMILPSDPEHGLSIGTPVSEDRVNEVFSVDVKNTLADCRRLYPGFNDFPTELKLILGNMMFNLGASRLKGFRRMNSAIMEKDYKTAADEMINSKWHRQLPRRSTRLHDRMVALS